MLFNWKISCTSFTRMLQYSLGGILFMKKSVKIGWIITFVFMILSYIFFIRVRHDPWYVFLGVLLLYLSVIYLAFWGTSLGITGYIFQVIFKKQDWAVTMYKLAIKYKTKSSYSLGAYGLILLREENFDQALPLFQQIHRINPTIYMDKIAYTNQSVCLWKMGKIEEAIQVLEKMRAKYDYISADTYTTLGYLYLLNKDFEQAIHYTQLALEDTPTHGPAFDNLGQIYFHQNDLEKAEEYFLKALEEKDTMVDSKYYLGLIYEQQGNLDLAKEYFQKAHESNVSVFSTVTLEQVTAKYEQYHTSNNQI